MNSFFKRQSTKTTFFFVRESKCAYLYVCICGVYLWCLQCLTTCLWLVPAGLYYDAVSAGMWPLWLSVKVKFPCLCAPTLSCGHLWSPVVRSSELWLIDCFLSGRLDRPRSSESHCYVMLKGSCWGGSTSEQDPCDAYLRSFSGSNRSVTQGTPALSGGIIYPIRLKTTRGYSSKSWRRFCAGNTLHDLSFSVYLFIIFFCTKLNVFKALFHLLGQKWCFLSRPCVWARQKEWECVCQMVLSRVQNTLSLSLSLSLSHTHAHTHTHTHTHPLMCLQMKTLSPWRPNEENDD